MSQLFTREPQRGPPDESLKSLTITQRQPDNSHLKTTPLVELLRGFVRYFKSPTTQRRLPELQNEPIHKHAPLDIHYPGDLSVPIIPTLEALSLGQDEKHSRSHFRAASAVVKVTAPSWLTHRDATPEVEPIDGAFVEDAVRVFKDQRIRGYQFAVIILSPDRQVTLRNVSPEGYSVTDNSIPTHPPNDHTLHNYIVARPDGGEHTEMLLLRRFPTLLARNASCRSIVLYSWFLPCLHCAEEIARVLGRHTDTHRVTVVYTSTLTKNEGKDGECVRIMEAAGVAVRKGEHKKRVSRAV